MLNAPRVSTFIALLLGLSKTVTVLADPPSQAPAHAWRAKHDGPHIGYMGDRWNRDYGILAGHCNREAVATVLGGVTGARAADEGSEAVATIIGAAAGALVSNRTGRKLDEADKGCFGHALEIAGPGQVVTWTNSEKGVKYEMALGTGTEKHGDSCRAYILLSIVGTVKTFRRGVACQSKAGVWNVVTAISSQASRSGSGGPRLS